MLHFAVTRIRGSHLNPDGEVVDDGRLQTRLIGRHRRNIVVMSHGSHQRARIRVPRQNRGCTGFAARLPALFQIESQVAPQLLRIRAMALVTVLDKYWPNLFFEELKSVVRYAMGPYDRQLRNQLNAEVQSKPL